MTRIPATDVKINATTFRSKTSVVSVDMNNITVSGNSLFRAFDGCTSLTSVTNIPSAVTNMRKSYANCSNLVYGPTIPSGVTDVVGIFQGCPNLTTPPSLPSGVTNVQNSFRDCTNLYASPTLPSGVTDMSYTFYNCRSMSSMPTIPSSVTDMQSTFEYCENLSYVTSLSSGVTTMARTFYNCINLTTAPSIPSTVTNMTFTFSNCAKLTSAPSLPSGLVNMSGCFGVCTNMVTGPSTIPSSVTNIQSAFYGCANMTTGPSSIPSGCTNMYIVFTGCEKLASVPTLPDTVRFMDRTFSGCKNITSTGHIPTSVVNMAATYAHCENIVSSDDIPSTTTFLYETFKNCYSLTGNINIHSNQVTNATNCFANTSLSKNVYIPFTYANGVNTATYNAFTAAGYDDAGTNCGVYLKDIDLRTLTITPTPSDATVTLTVDGHPEYVQSGNSISVKVGTEVSYTVAKTNYTTVSSSITVDEDQTLSVSLVQNGFTLTINPTPADATVTLSVNDHPEYVQVGNTITVPNNTSVDWVVSKTGYISQSNSILMHQDETMNIELISGACVFTVVPVPSNCQVTIMDLEAGQMTSGVGEKSLATTVGNTVRCIVSKSGYTTKTIDVPVTGTTRMTITLEASMATITLITNAPNPTIVLSAVGYVQDGNSITVPVGTRVDYIVSATGYITRQNTIFADVDKTYEIILTEDGEMATLTIAPKPTSTSVTINATGYDTVSGQGTQSMSVVKDTPVTYTVTYGNQTLEVDSINPLYVSNDMLIEYDMGRQHVKQSLTYNETPSTGNHLIGTFIYTSVEGTMVVGPTDASRGTPLFYPKGEQVWMIFHTENFSHTVGATGTYNTNGGTSYGIRVNKILTVNFSPADAVVTVVDGAGNVIPAKTESAGQNTYYFPYYNSGSTTFYNNTCNITVSRAGYVSQSTTATRQYASDGSVTVNLVPES